MVGRLFSFWHGSFLGDKLVHFRGGKFFFPTRKCCWDWVRAQSPAANGVWKTPRKGQYCQNNTIYLCERGNFSKVPFSKERWVNNQSFQEKQDVFCWFWFGFACFGLVWFGVFWFGLVWYAFVCLFVCSKRFFTHTGHLRILGRGFVVTAQHQAFTFTFSRRRCTFWAILSLSTLVNQLENRCWFGVAFPTQSDTMFWDFGL